MPWSMTDRVENLEFRVPVYVGPNEALRRVAHTLWVEDIGAVVVGDESGALGIISERDFIAKVAQGADLDRLTAKDIMTKHVVAAGVGDTLGDVAYQMLDDGIRHLPVVDDQAHIVGMVSVRDLLRPLLSGGPPDSRQ
jgi:CBS domain-containing protein